MKAWSNAEMTEIKVNATNNIQTTEWIADDFQDGVGYKQGDSDKSGGSYPIPYYPA